MFSVASCTTRSAFWLLSSGSHLCASKASDDRLELNSELHRSHTPSREGVLFTMRSLARGHNPSLPLRSQSFATCGFQTAPLPIVLSRCAASPGRICCGCKSYLPEPHTGRETYCSRCARDGARIVGAHLGRPILHRVYLSFTQGRGWAC